MVKCIAMKYDNLVTFLKDQIGLTQKEIDFVIRHCRRSLGSLPVVLWHYGFISMDQFSDLMLNYKWK